MPDDLAHEIDIFEGQMELMGQAKLDEKVFMLKRVCVAACTASATTMADGARRL